MMELELDFQVKVRLDQKVVAMEIYIYSLIFTLMIYLKDLMKTYFSNVRFQLLMRLLVHQLKFQQLTVVKPKLKYLLELKVVNNLG